MDNKCQVLDDQIEDVLNTFDFDKCAKMMKAVNWTWAGEGEVTADMLKDTATYLFRMMQAKGYDSSSTGGLFAKISEGQNKDGANWVHVELFFGIHSYQLKRNI